MAMRGRIFLLLALAPLATVISPAPFSWPTDVVSIERKLGMNDTLA